MVGISDQPKMLRVVRPWLLEEDQAIAFHKHHALSEAVRDLRLRNRTATAIRLRRDKLRREDALRLELVGSAPPAESPAAPASDECLVQPAPPAPPAPPTFEDDRQRTADNLLQAQHEELQRRYAKALKDLT